MFSVKSASFFLIAASSAISQVQAVFAQDHEPVLRPAIDTNKKIESVKTPLINDTDSTATNTPLGRDKTPPPPTLD